MLREVRKLQHDIGMGDGELLKFAQSVSGCVRLDFLEELMPVEQYELLEELRGMATDCVAAG